MSEKLENGSFWEIEPSTLEEVRQQKIYIFLTFTRLFMLIVYVLSAVLDVPEVKLKTFNTLKHLYNLEVNHTTPCRTVKSLEYTIFYKNLTFIKIQDWKGSKIYYLITC